MNLGGQYNPAHKPKRKKKKTKGKYGRNVPKYREKEVHKRDKGYCQYCGKFTNSEGKGSHHIIFRSKANPYHVHDLSNLITLCDNCHQELHGKWGKKLILWCIDWAIKRYGKEAVERVRKISKGVGMYES